MGFNSGFKGLISYLSCLWNSGLFVVTCWWHAPHEFTV